MRQLSLHASALSNDEYELYTDSLNDMADAHGDPNTSYNDAYYEDLQVGVREARAWFRGRYSHVAVSDIDTILKFFHPTLGHSETLSGGQFFAAFRLIIHAECGDGVDRSLAFTQARPNSNPKPVPSAKPPPPPVAPRPQSMNARSGTIRAPSTDRNPFMRQDSDTQMSSSTAAEPINLTPNPPPPQHRRSSSKITHNPFLQRDRSPSKTGGESAIVSGKIPPLPPRKPTLPLVPPPRHISQPASAPPAIPAKSYPPVIPSSSLFASLNTATSALPSHVTSPLIRQSLQASKTAQAMKKAEEHLEKERVLNVVKKAVPRSISPAKIPARTSSLAVRDDHPPSSASGSSNGTRPRAGSEKDLERPPLPARRKSVASKTVSIASSTSSRLSMDEIASASMTKPKPSNPFGSPHPSIDTTPSARSAPPTHPDRKPSNPDSNAGYNPPTPTSPTYPNQGAPTRGVFRSKSLHHNSPPPVPPPRRRRPESISVQITPTASPESSPFFTPNAVHQRFSQEPYDRTLPSSASTPAFPSFPALSRRLSQPAQRRDSTTTNSNSADNNPSPIAHLQRTLTSLQLKAQPKLDAARYKAEAGLSRKGYVHHPHRSPWVEEGEEGLMPAQRARRDLGMDWQTDEEGDGAGVDSSFGDDDPGQDTHTQGTRGRVPLDARAQWPVGEGYKPL